MAVKGMVLWQHHHNPHHHHHHQDHHRQNTGGARPHVNAQELGEVFATSGCLSQRCHSTTLPPFVTITTSATKNEITTPVTKQ